MIKLEISELVMYIDLNVPVPNLEFPQQSGQSKKGKGQPKQPVLSSKFVYSPAQLATVEDRVDLLIHLGYTVLALNQTVQKRVDPKNHVNLVESLVEQLRKRPGVVFLKRITIVLDEDSEKGFGLASSSVSLFNAYDIIALTPTTIGTLSLAALTHSQPSPLTAHIISLPLTMPRLPFHLKHTLVRTAIKNGVVFEINYAGAFGGGESEGTVGESSSSMKRNWWASAREVVRVTKGKGLVVSGGVLTEADLRAPRDISNLITMLALAPDLAHRASTKTPHSLILRAQTRRTYRAILSEPKLVVPVGTDPSAEPESSALPSTATSVESKQPELTPDITRKRTFEDSENNARDKEEGSGKKKKKSKK